MRGERQLGYSAEVQPRPLWRADETQQNSVATRTTKYDPGGALVDARLRQHGSVAAALALRGHGGDLDAEEFLERSSSRVPVEIRPVRVNIHDSHPIAEGNSRVGR